MHLDYSIVSVVTSVVLPNVCSAMLVLKGSGKLVRLPILCGRDNVKIVLPLAGIVSVSCECMYLILFDE